MNIVHLSRSVATRESGGAQVADYRIVICHDSVCPGLDKKGHLLDGLDRSHHHDFRFVSDARTEDEIIADVRAMEEKETPDTGPQKAAKPRRSKA